MRASPLVDVIVPTFNQADFLKTAIESVVRQTHSNWKMTVINNFSSDSTREVVDSFADSRIKIIDFANDGVIAASRNLGIRAAVGDFIAFLDSDDWWYEEKLARCVQSLTTTGDIVCHAEVWQSERSERVVRYGPANRATYHELLLRGNRLSTSAIVGHTEVFRRMGGFAESSRYVTAEDYDLWLRMARVNTRFMFLEDVLGVYRIHSTSASAAVERHLSAELAVVEDHMDVVGSSTLQRRHRRARAYYSAGRIAQRNLQQLVALRKFLRTIGFSPVFWRVYPALVTLMRDVAIRGRRK